MAKRNREKFIIPAPEPEPERRMPDQLELEEYMATTVVMPAGAYDPYERPPGSPPPPRKSRPQDLRKLSEWIKIRREVEALARENGTPDIKSGG